MPSTASYTPSANFNWESNGHSVKVTRSSVGNYSVSLVGFNGLGGAAQITAYGSTKVRCQLSALATNGTTQKVGVRCFNYNGKPTDARYSLAFSR
jgi:hypothetical protein